MGLFDLFKRQAPAPSADEPPGEAFGWNAIEQAFAELYPGQKAKHWTHDGVMRINDLRNPPENPFDGVNVYDAGSFWHYVSFGMSDLYGKESKDEWSGFGYELTFGWPSRRRKSTRHFGPSTSWVAWRARPTPALRLRRGIRCRSVRSMGAPKRR